MATILDMTDIIIPQLVETVEFYTVDPETQSFVLFGSVIKGSDQTGVYMPVYIITNTEIPELTLSIQSSSNVIAKIIYGNSTQYDFTSIQDNNTIKVSNILSDTPVRLTVFYSISNTDIDIGEIEILWSY